MEVVVKLSKRNYRRLRDHVAADSVVFEPMERATGFEHSVEGVLFAGYVIPCDESQAKALLDLARLHCPECVPDIEKSLAAAR